MIYRFDYVPVHLRLSVEVEASTLKEALSSLREQSRSSTGIQKFLDSCDLDTAEIEWLYAKITVIGDKQRENYMP